ncbi:MAG: DUF1127 domain-containing protein [Alphaproteobacteria bacterium]
MTEAILPAPRLRWGAMGVAWLPKAAGLLSAWRSRARDRQTLGRLNDHMLRDIGLTRHQVVIECDKPFWQG